MEPLLIVLFILLIPVAIMMGIQQKENFADLMKRQVAARGGSVVGWESRSFFNGPFWVKGKGQVIVKMVYRDSDGALRQVWGRTGTLLRDDEMVWDYDDGEYNV